MWGVVVLNSTNLAAFFGLYLAVYEYDSSFYSKLQSISVPFMVFSLLSPLLIYFRQFIWSEKASGKYENQVKIIYNFIFKLRIQSTIEIIILISYLFWVLVGVFLIIICFIYD